MSPRFHKRCVAVAVAVVAGLLGVVVQGGAPVGAATPGWVNQAGSVADWLTNGCLSVNAAVLGTGSGVAMGGYVPSKLLADSVPNPYPEGSTARTLADLQAQRIREWWIESQATPVTTGPGGAGVPTASVAEAIAPDSVMTPYGNVVRIGAEAGGAAVAANGAAVIAEGSAAGSAVAGAGASLSVGSVAAVAAVAAGSFCGTIGVLDWAFGAPKVEPIDLDEGFAASAVRDCTGAPAGVQPGDRCVTVAWGAPELSTTTYVVAPRRSVVIDGQLSGQTPWLPERSTTGAVVPANTQDFPWPARPFRAIDQSNSAQLVIPCADPDAFCGMFTTWSPGGWPSPAIAQVRMKSPSGLAGQTLIDPTIFKRGPLNRLAASVDCKTPGGATTTITGTSQRFYAWTSNVPYELPQCPAGTAPVKVNVNRQYAASGGSDGPVVFADRDVVLSWTLPPETSGNSATLSCLVVGATACPTDVVPGDPTKVAVGGPSGVQVLASAPNTRSLMNGLVQGSVFPSSTPDAARMPDAGPAPSVTQAPSSTPSGGTEPGSSGPVPGQAGGPASGTDPGGGENPGATGEACWPAGWAMFNPLEWVYRPVRCVLVWAFVPSVSVTERFESLESDAQSKPPFNVVMWASATVTGFVDGFTDDGACGLWPDFNADHGGHGRIPCVPPGGVGLAFAYALQTIAIVAATAFACWHMTLRAFSGSPEGGGDDS